MSRTRRKYLDPRDWEIVYAAEGRDAAGLPPPGTRVPGVATSSEGWRQQLPPPAPLFTGPGPERPEDYEARQRRQRVNKILAKLDHSRRPWFRI